MHTMPLFFIHARNSEFNSRDDGAEYDHPEVALSAGIQIAVTLASEEIAGGKHNTAVEIVIERHDGIQVLRSVVTITVSPLVTIDGHRT